MTDHRIEVVKRAHASFAFQDLELMKMEMGLKESLRLVRAARTALRSQSHLDDPDLQTLRQVCDSLAIDMGIVLSPRRDQSTCQLRFKVIQHLYGRFQWSSTRIGKVLGVHHTTVLHAVGYSYSLDLPATQKKS